jgi:hypothetical protein
MLQSKNIQELFFSPTVPNMPLCDSTLFTVVQEYKHQKLPIGFITLLKKEMFPSLKMSCWAKKKKKELMIKLKHTTLRKRLIMIVVMTDSQLLCYNTLQRNKGFLLIRLFLFDKTISNEDRR